MAELLIEYGADVNQPGYEGAYPLHSCGGAEQESAETCQLLINNGAVVNVYEATAYQTPVMWAARAGYPAVLSLLITYGADILVRDSYGRQAAHYGAAADSEDVYMYLRDAGADFDTLDHEQNTPLHAAAQYGAVAYARLLLGAGAEASPQNHRADQPSHIAARANNVPLLKVAIDPGPNLGPLFGPF